MEAQFAARFDVDPARVLVTAGADEAIQRIALAALEPGRIAAATMPTFEMIGRAVRLAGAKLREIPWLDGPLPIETLAEAASSSAVTFAVTPNNPTGSVIGTDALLGVADVTGLLVADLAYAEYASDDPTPKLLQRPNALVLRTLSKAWGLAGLRVGYAIGPAEVVDAMRAAGGPYTVSAPSLAIAEDWLSAGAMRVGAHVQRVRAERAELTALLADLGARPLPSEANFVLARFQDAAGAHARLRALGVHVRAFATAPLRDCLRITCPGDRDDFILLCRALRAALEEQS